MSDAMRADTAARRRLWWLAAVVALVSRPRLWPTAVRVATGLLPEKWWRKWPPLPRPARRWLEFRMETAYGDVSARPSSRDVTALLDWCRSMRRM